MHQNPSSKLKKKKDQYQNQHKSFALSNILSTWSERHFPSTSLLQMGWLQSLFSPLKKLWFRLHSSPKKRKSLPFSNSVSFHHLHSLFLSFCLLQCHHFPFTFCSFTRKLCRKEKNLFNILWSSSFFFLFWFIVFG